MKNTNQNLARRETITWELENLVLGATGGAMSDRITTISKSPNWRFIFPAQGGI